MFSTLVIDVNMKRDIGNKLAGVFTPSLMIVLITFTTFWLGPHSIADRVTIGITAFLAIVTQFSAARAELPPISYISVSLDVIGSNSLILTFFFSFDEERDLTVIMTINSSS